MTERELHYFRIGVIVGENPLGITAAAMCDEMKRRGWAWDGICPEECGLAPGDLLVLPRRRLDA
jgi:hypothetical protein